MVRNSRRSVLRSASILGFSGLVGISSARSEPQEISECTVIDEPGDYVLMGDLVNDDLEAPCILITADNVNLDGRGYELRGGDGVKVTGANVTVENLTVAAGFDAIRYTQTSKGVIRNNTTRAEAGITLESTTKSVIEENECTDDISTIFLDNADGNTIRDNDIDGEYGPLLSESSQNVVEDNHVQQAEVGVFMDGSRNVLRRNTIDSALSGGIIVWGDRHRLHENTVTKTGSGAGISLANASRNRLHRNEVTDGEDVGILLDDADENWLVKNTVCRNEDGQIVIDDESTGNRLINNDTDCSE